MHQLRRHFAHLRHPIVGDVRYGDGRHNRMFRERFGVHRLLLHAERLVLPDLDGTEIAIEAQRPAAFGVGQ
jgi:tRNA pseudouridine65 synthase